MTATTSFPRELSDADTLLWRIEADPVLRSPVIAVALLDREPEWAAVIDAFRRATHVLPRLAQRVERTPFSFGRLHWQADPSFAPEHHLRRIRATHEGGVGAALEVAAIDATAAFDPARPPWQAVVVEGLGDGRAALVLRFHHSITDGVGGVELAEAIFDRQRRPRRVVARSRPPVEPPPRTAHPAARAGRVARGAVGAALDPIRTGRAAARTLASVGRILAPTPGAMSPLFVGRGIDRRLLVAVRPMAAIERAAEAVGGTVNDVFLAAVGGALRDYHERLGKPVGAVRVTMPISLRAPGDPPGGNRFAPARFVLPVDAPDPAVRARIAGDIVKRWRAEPSLAIADLLAAVLNRLPSAAVVGLFGAMLRSIDVDAVDVPGLRRPAFLAGAQVEQLWAFAPPTGAALSITLLSHGESACVGLTCDLDAVTDPDLLLECVEHALDQVVALAEEAA